MFLSRQGVGVGAEPLAFPLRGRGSFGLRRGRSTLVRRPIAGLGRVGRDACRASRGAGRPPAPKEVRRDLPVAPAPGLPLHVRPLLLQPPGSSPAGLLQGPGPGYAAGALSSRRSRRRGPGRRPWPGEESPGRAGDRHGPRDMASGGGYLKAEKRRATWSSKRLQHPRRMPGLCMRTHVCYTTKEKKNKY